MDLSERPERAFSRHPWEKARFRFFHDVLSSVSWPTDGPRVLDAGAGDGWFSSQLLESLGDSAQITCWDAEYTDNLITDLQATNSKQITFRRNRPDSRFDLVMLLDVLEHVEDDLNFLQAIVKTNLEPDGVVLISVPAWQALYSSHDTRLRHFRRYSPAACRRVIQDAGLTITRHGGLFHSLLAPRAAQVAKEKVLGADSGGNPQTLEWNAGAIVTKAVDTALAVDNFISHRLADVGIDVPGMSWWALCKVG
jgi:SAM-dependent methyltransferase